MGTYLIRNGGSRALLLSAVVLALQPAFVRAQSPDGLAAVAALEQSLVQAIEKAEQSVVSIARYRPADSRLHFGRFDVHEEGPDNPNFVPNEFGAGVIIEIEPGRDRSTRRIYILTNYHVVRNRTNIVPDPFQLHVRMYDRRGSSAQILAADPRSDLAILMAAIELRPGESEPRPMRLGDASRPFKKGQIVVALGNPYAIARDGSASASWGIISNISRRPEQPPQSEMGSVVREETLHHLGTLLQVDTRLNLGTSGGPIINLQGEMIGISTSLAALAGYEKSVGYAIPIDESTLRVIKTLREGKEVEYGFLGVSFSSDFNRPHDFSRSTPTPGVKISQVIRRGPAELAGIRPDDVVLKVNGKPVYSRVDLTREIGKIAPGERVRLDLARSDNPVVNVELGKWPVVDDEGIIAPHRRFEPWRGLVVDFSTARHRYWQMGATEIEYPKGVLVTEVFPQS
ncbi:MAG TPA: trypsin-like peptidase domain-containing protein, partial [Planctomycetaceae bacterium]|nr:trypsin-like peptidase domain-containing protein [Planctomycetaceae bacterium]